MSNEAPKPSCTVNGVLRGGRAACDHMIVGSQSCGLKFGECNLQSGVASGSANGVLAQGNQMEEEVKFTPSKEWPDGDCVETPCPYCGNVNTQDISIVRDMGGDHRDADCTSCGSDYHIQAHAQVVTSHKLRAITTLEGFKGHQAI